MRFLIAFFFAGYSLCVFGQVSNTANDQVPSYGQPFGYGVNMGVYPPYTDYNLADIAAGNPELNVRGIGVNSLRPALPEEFLNFWGYDIRVSAFEHYLDLGCIDNTVFIGIPSDEHLDPEVYCQGRRPMTFLNLYEPIWDDNNGTPVNEDNHFAFYLYQLVQKYGQSITYYEVTNEPDFSFTVNSILPPSEPDSWYNKPPDPCNYAFGAPVYQYIRMLRVAYEVIKTYDDRAYIAAGGIGYPSFLDNLLRYTDNPVDGSDHSDFPLKGGAYFDVLSYHSYPHIDNSMRFWDNSIMDFGYNRHSDAAVDGFLRLKTEMQDVLDNYGYDGTRFPRKRYIATETNVPSQSFGEFLGTFSHQRNYVGKVLIKAQQEGIDQVHFYTLADLATPENATFEYERMGLYAHIKEQELFTHERNPSASMFATTSRLLNGYRYDEATTELLDLPETADGAAFVNDAGEQRFALWARTQKDRSEEALVYYSVPATLDIDHLYRYEWNHDDVGDSCIINSQLVPLTAVPTFFEPATLTAPEAADRDRTTLFPNPTTDQTNLFFELREERLTTVRLFADNGQLVDVVTDNQRLAAGTHQLKISRRQLPAGTYIVELRAGSRLDFMKVTFR